MTERTLVLLRHARAEHVADVADVDRRLTDRGRADATAAGVWLSAHGYRPDLVICSPATRTRQTWHAVAGAAGQAGTGPTVRYAHEVYDSGATVLLDLVRGVDQAVRSVLLVGHNPTISQLSALLDPGAGWDPDGLRTSGLAVHRVTASWAVCGTVPAVLARAHTARG